MNKKLQVAVGVAVVTNLLWWFYLQATAVPLEQAERPAPRAESSSTLVLLKEDPRFYNEKN